MLFWFNKDDIHDNPLKTIQQTFLMALYGKKNILQCDKDHQFGLPVMLCVENKYNSGLWSQENPHWVK